jgi:hypothetical protein
VILGKKVYYKGILATVIQDNGHCKIEAYHKTMYVQKSELIDYTPIHRDILIAQILCNEQER